MERKTGINPERDLDRVYFAATKSGGEDGFLALAVGRFDPAKVGKAVQEEEKGKVTTKQVEGATVYVVGDGTKAKNAVAVPSATLLLMGSVELVDAALANRAKGAKPLESNAQMAATLKGLQPAPTFWFVAGQSLIDQLPKPGAGGPNIPTPRSLVLTGDIDPNVALRLIGEMADEAAAKNMADTLNGFKAMAGMMAGDKPEVKDIATALSIKAEAKRVEVALQFTPAMLEASQASLKKARREANEASAIGDLRTVISGQMVYQSSFGHYGELRCLADVKKCHPTYEGAAPNFLDPALAEAKDKNGYKRAFHPGPRSGEGFESFAYTAVPVTPGTTGQRSFCGDETGLICEDSSGAPFQVSGGHCPQGCTPLP
jgi:hypothetical protein